MMVPEMDLLTEAIDLSATFEEKEGMTPFGAIVIQDGEVIGRGVSSVVADHDPTAHAEVGAIREACKRKESHLLPEAILISSAYPCPLCLMACVWAGIKKVYYAAELQDSHVAGFEDKQYYAELTRGADALGVELVGVGGDIRARAAEVLMDWKCGVEARRTLDVSDHEVSVIAPDLTR